MLPNPSCHLIMNNEQSNDLNRRDAEFAEFLKGFLRVLCGEALKGSNLNYL